MACTTEKYLVCLRASVTSLRARVDRKEQGVEWSGNWAPTRGGVWGEKMFGVFK